MSSKTEQEIAAIDVEIEALLLALMTLREQIERRMERIDRLQQYRATLQGAR